MSASIRRSVFALAALLAAVPAGEAAAQSLFSARGLGYTLEPLDARARGLGGVSTGLAGGRLSIVNPAEAAGLPAPGLVVTFQPDLYDSRVDGAETSGTTARFPLILAGFPIGRRVTATVGYGSFLDQNWQVEQTDSVLLSTGRVPVTDRFVSKGGIARFRAGAAYRLSDAFAVGLAADVFTGSVRDSVSRVIPEFFAASSSATFTYGGVGVTGGVRWTPNEALSVAAAVSGGGGLTADVDIVNDEGDPLEGDGEEKSYSTPVSVDVGASARVTQNTVLAASGRWAGWSAVDEDFAEGQEARDAASASVGVEWEGLAWNRRVFPVRLGGRYTQLPFRWAEGADFADERAVSAGLGARLAGGAALLDLAGERGWRGGEAAGVDESFWRFSVSLTLLGR